MFELLTTFHKAGWEQYGRRMVETFLAHWPSNIKLNVYCENVDVNLNNPRIIEHDIFKTCDKLRPFIDLYNSREANGYRNGVRDFKYDAIKFSYKVFAQCHSIRNSSSEKLIFIDADTLTFASPPLHLIDRLLPETDLTAYLGRPKNNKLPFAETGFIMYNLKHPNILEFADVFEQLYTSGELFDLDYQVDCYTFDTARKRIESKYQTQSNDITGPDGLGKKHPFVNSILGTFMDHLKGDNRKNKGKSSLDDFKDRIKTERSTQPYWNQ